MGSYEFVEDYMAQLTKNAVAYLNMDTAVNNPDLMRIKSTPNMEELLYTAAQETPSPKREFETLFDFSYWGKQCKFPQNAFFPKFTKMTKIQWAVALEVKV